MREETDRAPRSIEHRARREDPSTTTEETSPSLFQAIRETILHALSQHERLLVVLWYVERMSIREIAEVLDPTDQQVRRTHERIVERLREAIAPAVA